MDKNLFEFYIVWLQTMRVKHTAAERRPVVSSKVTVHFSQKKVTINLPPLFLTTIRWSKNKHLHWVCFPLVTSSLLKRRPLCDPKPQGDRKHAASRLYYTTVVCFYERRQLCPRLIGSLLSLFNLRSVHSEESNNVRLF